MHPYEVEIFDKDLSLKYHTLLGVSEFSYTEDVLDPEKNKIKISSEFAPTGANAPKGWFIRIFRPDEEYQGIISAFEPGEILSTVTFSQMITLFDINTYIVTAELSETNIESYIKKLITSEFINNPDSLHITGLSASEITTVSSTKGIFDFQDSEDERQSINLLDDLVYPAFETYSVITDVKFDPQQKKITVQIGCNSDAERTLEADLPNVTDSEFTIRKSSKEVNKVDVFDISTSPPVKTSFFLHPGGSWDLVDDDRIYPVFNNIQTADGYAAAKAVVDNKYAALLATMNSYAEYNGTLTSEQKTKLESAMNTLWNLYYSTLGFPADQITQNGGTIYSYPGDEGIGRTKNVNWEDEKNHVIPKLMKQVTVSAAPLSLYTYQIDFDDSKWASNNAAYATARNSSANTGHSHCSVQAELFMANMDHLAPYWHPESGIFMGYYYPYDTVTATVYFTAKLASKAVSEYKKTSAYTNEIAEAFGAAAAEAVKQKAVSIFNKNKYSNNIEITCALGDRMIKPDSMKMGQVVKIIHNGVVYTSLLSGREIKNGLITLIFGTVRLGLTAYLKGRY